MKVSSNKRIIKKVFYAIDIELASPLNVSSGDSLDTDKDVITNGSGELFIPGTSIAGALRNNIDKDSQIKVFGGEDNRKNEEKKEGNDKNNNTKGLMSSIYISDLYFDKDSIVITRDGIQLNDDKSVNNKFDMQAIETGAQGVMYIYYVRREHDDIDYEAVIQSLILDIASGDIRFGSNKNRGFGQIKICNIYNKEFTTENVEEYIAFDKRNKEDYGTPETFEQWSSEKKTESEYVTLSVPLGLTGGISIRKYSTRPGEADYEQITVSKCDERGNKIPVIPGTSWNGAIRSDMKRIIIDLLGGDKKQANNIINRWFGYIKENKPKESEIDALQSMISIQESEIIDSISMNVTRNKINRFDASTINGALYTERASFGGRTNLVLKVRKENDRHYEACIGALLLVLKDIGNGYQNIGGLGAIGRGIFEADGEIIISEGNEKNYLREFASFIKEENQ